MQAFICHFCICTPSPKLGQPCFYLVENMLSSFLYSPFIIIIYSVIVYATFTTQWDIL